MRSSKTGWLDAYAGYIVESMENKVDGSWDADIAVETTSEGLFVAVLVLTPPPELGPAVRLSIEGEYKRPELAEMAAVDAYAAMTRGA